jgi:hypothetical protein
MAAGAFWLDSAPTTAGVGITKPDVLGWLLGGLRAVPEQTPLGQ